MPKITQPLMPKTSILSRPVALYGDFKEKLFPCLLVNFKPKLLIVDEMSYLTLDKTGATVLFQLISKRYEKGSIILTSNKSFTDWGNVLGDHVIATAY